jgi:hypothetical protein
LVFFVSAIIFSFYRFCSQYLPSPFCRIRQNGFANKQAKAILLKASFEASSRSQSAKRTAGTCKQFDALSWQYCKRFCKRVKDKSLKYKLFSFATAAIMLCIRKQNELHNLVEVEIFANELANENVLKA